MVSLISASSHICVSQQLYNNSKNNKRGMTFCIIIFFQFMYGYLYIYFFIFLSHHTSERQKIPECENTLQSKSSHCVESSL